MRDIKNKNVYSRLNSNATPQYVKTERANGVHSEGVAGDNRSSCIGNKTTTQTSEEAKVGKIRRPTVGATLNIRPNLSSSNVPKPLQLRLLPTFIAMTSFFFFTQRTAYEIHR